jgi:mono/diheme cytochrome c family protein
MRKRSKIMALLVLIVVVAGLTLWWAKAAGGFSAREEPTAVEAAMARRMRSMSMPSRAKEMPNPVPASPEVLTEARRHFADHCAVCHANDGSGSTEMGQGLYPKVPDIRLPATESLSDGEIYFIIHNGIRLSGMPAWGNASDGDHDHESWALVHFIRHLPQLSPAELEDMKQFNPQSPMEMQEQREEEEFLNGPPKKK